MSKYNGCLIPLFENMSGDTRELLGIEIMMWIQVVWVARFGRSCQLLPSPATQSWGLPAASNNTRWLCNNNHPASDLRVSDWRREFDFAKRGLAWQNDNHAYPTFEALACLMISAAYICKKLLTLVFGEKKKIPLNATKNWAEVTLGCAITYQGAKGRSRWRPRIHTPAAHVR